MKSTPQSNRVFKSSRAESSFSPLHRTWRQSKVPLSQSLKSKNLHLLVLFQKWPIFFASWTLACEPISEMHNISMVGCCVIFFVFFCQPGFQLSLPLLFWFKVENLAVVFTHLKNRKEEKQRKSKCWNWWKARQGKRKPLEDQHTSSPIWNGVSAFSTSFLPATKFSWTSRKDTERRNSFVIYVGFSKKGIVQSCCKER